MGDRHNGPLALENRITDALANSRAASADLMELVREAEIEIGHAQHIAAQAKESAADPTLTPDLELALKNAQVAELTATRLSTLLAHLRQHLECVLADERAAKWDAEYRYAQKVRDEAALRFQRLDELFEEAASIFAQAAAADKIISDVHGRAPSGERRRLLQTELHARGMQSFSRGQPSILKETRLVDYLNSETQLWPPVARPDFSYLVNMVPGPKFEGDCTGDWWKGKAAQDAVQARSDAEQLVKAETERKQLISVREVARQLAAGAGPQKGAVTGGGPLGTVSDLH